LSFFLYLFGFCFYYLTKPLICLYELFISLNEYLESFVNLYITSFNISIYKITVLFHSLEESHNTINYSNDILNFVFSLHIVNVLLMMLPVILSVAFMTIIERKQLAAMQRRVGPNTVGIYGVLQPFADALKLVIKENVIPAQSNKLIFFLAPASSLFFSFLGWGIIPFGTGLTIFDYGMGILYTLALSSLGIYGILFAG